MLIAVDSGDDVLVQAMTNPKTKIQMMPNNRWRIIIFPHDFLSIYYSVYCKIMSNTKKVKGFLWIQAVGKNPFTLIDAKSLSKINQNWRG